MSDKRDDRRSLFFDIAQRCLPVENHGGSDFPGKHEKSKNGLSACGKPWRVADDGGHKKDELPVDKP